MGENLVDLAGGWEYKVCAPSRKTSNAPGAVITSHAVITSALPLRHSAPAYTGLTAGFDRRDAVNTQRLRSLFSRRNLVPLTFIFLLLLVAVCGFVASRAQSTAEGEREVVDKIPKHLPIKIKIKKEKEEKVKDLKNEDWLGDLELEVTNTGTKPIYFLEIVLDMPDVIAPNGLNIAI
jgi:hypothetical protein